MFVFKWYLLWDRWDKTKTEKNGQIGSELKFNEKNESLTDIYDINWKIINDD